MTMSGLTTNRTSIVVRTNINLMNLIKPARILTLIPSVADYPTNTIFCRIPPTLLT